MTVVHRTQLSLCVMFEELVSLSRILTYISLGIKSLCFDKAILFGDNVISLSIRGLDAQFY